MPGGKQMKNPITALIILDGFGYSEEDIGNAITQANTPNIDRLWNENPHTFIQASGLAVGLPEGQMGNSEVGHLNLGAGRIVYQELTRITKNIEEKTFFENPAFIKAIENVKANNSALHLLGLVSDGGVHSHNTHLYALLELAKEQSVKNVYVHCFLDGRDTPPQSGKRFVQELEDKIKEIGIGEIATVSGRYYSMDRDKRWERTQLAYETIVLGKGETATSAVEAIQESYKNDITDEFMIPTVICKNHEAVATINENDSIIFFNFRPDRARQITWSLVDEEFIGFTREKGYFPLTYVTMTQYEKNLPNVIIAFEPQSINNPLGEYLSQRGMKQLRIAETEKYAHVTYFFNGGIEKEFSGEDRVLIPSPKVATYDMKPEMSAYGVTDKVLEAIDSEKYDLMVLNFANADMVGHSGILSAAVKAVEAVDLCLGKVVEAIIKKGGRAIITADHGNAEKMVDYETGKPFTAHTSNLVKCIFVGDREVKLKQGKLSDIAPTLLELMNLDKPVEMTGQSIIEK
jgi:2,3-bisphosphoglycerate-independent phosphoglycerate mutase